MVIIVSIIVLALVLLGVVLVDSIYCNRRLAVTPYKLENGIQSQKGEKIKLVFLSDLHGRTYGTDNQRLLEVIKKQKPDLILIGGDMIVKEPEPDFSVALALIGELVKVAPVYYANGNHEKKVMDFWEESKEAFLLYKRHLEELGVVYLINESSVISCKGRQIEIVGLDLDFKDYQKCWHKPTLTVEELKRRLPKRKREADYRILLAHNPKYFPLYDNMEVDLVLSGHVHGGIMILPVLGGVIAPDLRIFPKYDFGKFEGKNATMLLSKGLGVHSINVRVFNIPEILAIEI